jgi:ABC-type multidrug transport system fused ATPase/permease subunit
MHEIHAIFLNKIKEGGKEMKRNEKKKTKLVIVSTVLAVFGLFIYALIAGWLSVNVKDVIYIGDLPFSNVFFIFGLILLLLAYVFSIINKKINKKIK